MGPITEAAPLSFQDSLPEHADVLIVGGGIIGVSAAFCLAEQGQKVVLLEKGRIAGEQSSRNWGWIRKLGRDAAELPIMVEAARLWDGMAARIGADAGYRKEGIIYLARSEKEQAARDVHYDTAKQNGVAVDRLSRSEIDQIVQGRPGYWLSGIRCPSDGRAEPFIAVPAMARAAQKAGVVIRENCAVRGLQKSGGRVSGVVCEDGEVKADKVLLAGGSWTALFLNRHGIFFPQLSVRASAARLGPAPDVFAGCASDPEFAFRRSEDGGYFVALTDHSDYFLGPSGLRHTLLYAKSVWGSAGSLYYKLAAPKGYPDAWGTKRKWRDDETTPFEQTRVLDPAPWKGFEDKLKQRIAERFPALADVPITKSWAGMIDTMPDTVPTMDAIPGLEGAWVASGFSGHGFGIGPAVGQVMTDLMLGQPTGFDLSRFRFDRFSDGSPIRPGP